jgi:murein DD-endopeptidase MepM/ murein hydrolase activator NlpD
VLASGLHNPMPGGTLAGYAADTGLDIAGSPRPVFAIAAGTLDYSEAGHTLWTGKRDTPFTIRFELDAPIRFGNRTVTHVYYGHLSKLAHVQHEGDAERRHVDGGEYLGVSGVARGSPHLHVGLLLDGDVSQDWGTFLSADEVRRVLGGLPNKTRLPNDPAAEALAPPSGRAAAR